MPCQPISQMIHGPDILQCDRQMRALEGPTEQKFQRTDARLAALESSLQEIQQQQQAQATNQKEFQAATQDAFTQQEAGFKAFVATSMEQVRTELDRTVKQALDNQTTQINQNLLDLKSMFRSSKRIRPNDDDDMGSS